MAKDTKAIRKAINFLLERGCTLLGDENDDDKYCWHDLSGLTSNGTPFCAEVKDKSVTHLDYGDVMMDKQKEDKFNEQDYFKIFWVFNFYMDGYMGLANTKEKKKKYRRIPTPVTTEFGDHRKELQDVVEYKRFNLFKWSTKEKKYILQKKNWEKNKYKKEENLIANVSRDTTHTDFKVKIA